jgi:hypothetical protein
LTATRVDVDFTLAGVEADRILEHDVQTLEGPEGSPRHHRLSSEGNRADPTYPGRRPEGLLPDRRISDQPAAIHGPGRPRDWLRHA